MRGHRLTANLKKIQRCATCRHARLTEVMAQVVR